MIDDYAKATELVERMKAALPIPARPTSRLTDLLSQRGVRLSSGTALEIKKVYYAGDDGGIMCDVTPPGMTTEAIVCSLTHLRIHPKHPLAAEIRAYQETRTRRLKGWGSGPGIVTLERKKGDR